MKIVNLTPHAINIKLVSDEDEYAIMNGTGGIDPNTKIWLNVEPSGSLARVSQSSDTMPSVAGIPVTRSTFGEIEGLPEPAENTIYIVSGLVLARTNRSDVFAPGAAIRDENGRIIGCKGLSAAAPNTRHSFITFNIYDGHNAQEVDYEFRKKGYDYTCDDGIMFKVFVDRHLPFTKEQAKEIIRLADCGAMEGDCETPESRAITDFLRGNLEVIPSRDELVALIEWYEDGLKQHGDQSCFNSAVGEKINNWLGKDAICLPRR